MIQPPPRYRVVIDTAAVVLGSARVSAVLSTATIAVALCALRFVTRLAQQACSASSSAL